MLSYMLPTEDKPPPENRNGNVPRDAGYRIAEIQSRRDHHHSRMQNSHVNSPRMIHCGPRVVSTQAIPFAATTTATTTTTRPKVEQFDDIDEIDEFRRQNGNGVVNGCKESTEIFGDSPKHEITTTKKSTLYNSSGRVVKDDSLYSIVSDASTAGSEKKHKLFNGAKHVSLKRVSFGSSKGSMVETLVYETPVQEEPETNHFLEHNGRLPTTMVYGSPPTLPHDTDEGRERVRVSLLESTPCPSTPGVLLLEATTTDHFDDHLRAMATSPAELLTTHTEHTTPTYHTQISTDSGWDNPFRPDGDLSREADEIVELIKGGKPITPTPGQNAPLLPGGDVATPVANSVAAVAPGDDLDSSVSPLLSSTVVSNQQSSPRQANQGNGNAHGTPIKGSAAAANNQQAVHEKVAPSVNAATVEVGRVTAQGPGDASQVEHVTLKKKPKCKCCVLQ